jgi:hypothetical protein
MTRGRRLEAGLAILAVAAICLFPPRKPAAHAKATGFRVSRVFLFSSGISQFARPGQSSDGTRYEVDEPVEIDAGRLLAEVLLVTAAAGAWLVATTSARGGPT